MSLGAELAQHLQDAQALRPADQPQAAARKLRDLLAEQLRRARMRLARRSMLHFTRYTFPKYQVNWHHRVLCETLDEFVFGSIDRLMVFMPPRNGKSEVVSRRLPAFIFGQDPRTKIIATSYGSTLAAQMSRATQRVMDSDAYNRLFPSSYLSSSPWSDPEDIRRHFRQISKFQTVGSDGEEGTYRAAGTGEGITGMGAKWIIIDDPLKGWEQADSLLERNKQYDWYMSELYQRLEQNGKILLTSTRWHEDDLAGRLLAEAASDPEKDQWTVLSLPAIAEDLPERERERQRKLGYRQGIDPRQPGEALWADKFPLERLDKMRATLPPRVWNALQQQRPSSPAGNLFKRSSWKQYREAPAVMHEHLISVDATFSETGSSYVCIQVWGRVGAEKWLLDQVRARMGFVDTKNTVKSISQKWPLAFRKLIEKKANGAAIIDALSREIPGLIPVVPTEGKESRANAVSATVEAGNVYLPDPQIAPWIHDFIEECAMFPNAPNDDQVDSMTQALRDFATRESMDYEVFNRW